MAAPPKWAQDLVLRVALDEGRTDLPDMTWHRRATKHRSRNALIRAHVASKPGLQERMDAQTRHLAAGSSGRYYGPWKGRIARIHVTAGTDRADQKLVLLHELAHWLTPKDHHSPRFWDKAWELYRRYRVPLRYARIREGNYRKGALVAASRRPRERRPTDT